MGYILPINSYQSQQYANRLHRINDNDLKVSQLQQVQRVRAVQENKEEIEDQRSEELEMREAYDSLAASDSPEEVVGYVSPNPANMSLKNNVVTPKGDAIDAYV